MLTGSDPLARVKRAAAAKRRADEEYRAALAAALDAGVSQAAIGRAAGVTRQAVHKHATATTPPKFTPQPSAS